MSDKNKVIWSEGLFLRPQHFQQQERYFEHFVELRSGQLRPSAWGFQEVEIDRDLLAIGKLALKRARGVFPDGTPFSIPDQDAAPSPLEVPTDARGRRVFLAVPLRRAGAVDCGRKAVTDGLVRNAIGEVELRDVTQETATTALVEIGSLRCRFIVEGGAVEDFACLPTTRVIEVRADRQVLLDSTFMPTSQHIGACQPLSTFITELLGMLRQRGDALATIVSGSGRGGAAEFADFLKLQAINRYEPLIQHFAELAALHPEELYRWLVLIAGDLATLGTERRRPRAMPSYLHSDHNATFEPVIAALRAYLVEGISAVVSIPVELYQSNVYVARIVDSSLFDSAVFILAARADMPVDQMRRVFPQMTTLAPGVRLRSLVEGHQPGLELSPMPQVPPRIPYHAGYVYFEIARNSPLWADMKSSGAFAMFVREGFPNLALEMWAIRGV